LRPKTLVPVILILLIPVALAVLADDATRFTAVMDQIVANLNSGNYEAIYGLFNEVMIGKTPKEKAVVAFAALTEKLGKVTKVGPAEAVTVTEARFVLTFERGIVDVQLALDSDDRLAGLALGVRPLAAKVPDRQSTPLRLPFEGTWLTLWGGETPSQNYHVSGHPGQRFAYDFVATGADGLHYKNQGKKNEDYYAFGRKVLAPGDGIVTDIISGVRDNQPGVPNPFISMGNAVIIQHQAGEYSLLAHLKFVSIVVARGQKVKAGQLIGLCGNSGSAGEPQLHYSLANSPILVEATGIKTLFRQVKVTAGGVTKVKTDYSPVKGDLVSQG